MSTRRAPGQPAHSSDHTTTSAAKAGESGRTTTMATPDSTYDHDSARPGSRPSMHAATRASAAHQNAIAAATSIPFGLMLPARKCSTGTAATLIATNATSGRTSRRRQEKATPSRAAHSTALVRRMRGTPVSAPNTALGQPTRT